MNPGNSPATGPQQEKVSGVNYNSSRADLQKANSNNHNGDGQNVLYADGHVEFQTSPFAGMVIIGNNSARFNPTYRDNIYMNCDSTRTAMGADAWAGMWGPNDLYDTYLLPTDDDYGI